MLSSQYLYRVQCKLENYVDKIPIDKGKYQRLVKILIYLSHTTPKISYAVSTMSQFMQAL